MGNLFQELKRRNVFKVSSAYIIVAFVLAEAADLILPTLGSPAWVIQTIFLILAIGFPVAVVLAWAFELTPDGIKVDRDARGTEATVKTPTKKRRRIRR